MKNKIFYALGALLIGGMILVSCDKNTGTKTVLNSTLDSLSFAYGVSLADQGLVEYLERSGILESTAQIEYDYQMRISAATDSVTRQNLEKELKQKIDSVNKINAPKLNEFIKGFTEAVNSNDSRSAYIQGLSIGMQMSKQMIPSFNESLAAVDSTQKINNNQLIAGIVGVLRNSELPISKLEAGAFVQREMEKAQKAQMKKHEEELKVQYKDSIAAGEAFLAENGKRTGVVTLPSGLQYEILKAGKGEIPTAADRVKVHYHGTLLNGTVFDSSIQRKEPAVFGVTQVIPGWTEALQLMPVGSKWKLYIPYNLAYGAQSMGVITPFSNLIFEVELIGIEK